MATMPTRIDQELFDDAKVAGELQSRSAAQQISYWARLGRELEASPSTTQDMVERVLAGQGSYDELPAPAQAMVRVAWRDGVDERIAGLDLTARLQASGQSWAEADADGEVVVHAPKHD